MSTSNISGAGSAPRARKGSAVARKSAANIFGSRLPNEWFRIGISFITNIYNLQRLFPSRKFEANPLPALAVHERFRDRRKPADPAAVKIDLIHADDSVAHLGAIALANFHRRPESHYVRRAGRRRDDFGGLQALLELHDSLVQAGQLPFCVWIVLCVREPRPRDLDQLLKFIAQLLHAGGRDVIPRAGCERGGQRRKIGNVRSIRFLAREGFTHDSLFW